MKWFKHDSNASIDAKLKRVRLKYGMEGYGLYWYCLELIAQTVEIHNLSFELEHDAELIAMDTGINQERVQDMMTDLVKWGLFENNQGVVTCLKMASRTDEYTAKLLRTNSGHSPDKIPLNRIEENRIDKKRKEKKYIFSDEDYSLATWMFSLVNGLCLGDKEPDFDSWANDIRLIRERDERTYADIREIFTWANQNGFWQSNIRSPKKLREKWPQLVGQMTRGTSNGSHQQDNSAVARVRRANNFTEEPDLKDIN